MMTIDLELLRLLSISPTQYILLSLLYQKKDVNEINYNNEDIVLLEKKEFIYRVDNQFYLTSLGESLFQNDYEQYWEELRQAYPKISNMRRLHDKLDKTKQKYISLLKHGVSHTDVLRGLKIESDERIKAFNFGKFFPDWKSLSVYVNNKGWETFLEETDEKNNDYIDENKI